MKNNRSKRAFWEIVFNSTRFVLLTMGLAALLLECGMRSSECGVIPQSTTSNPQSEYEETVSISEEQGEYGVVLYNVTVSRAKVSEFLKTLSNICGVKITIDDDIDSTPILSSYVTVYLEKVPLEDMLEIVLGSKGLEYIIKKDEVLVTVPTKLPLDSPMDYLKGKAVQLYQKAQIKYPNSPLLTKAYFELGKHYFDTSSYLLAMQEFQTIVEAYPNDELTSHALINIAKCYEKLSDFENARHFYFRFIDIYRNNELLDDVYLLIGDTWHIQGKYTKAISIYKKILDDFPTDDPETSELTLLQLGRSYQQTGDYKDALEAFLTIRKKYSSEKYRAEVEYRIGNCLYQMGNYEKASAVLSSLLVTEPTNPIAADTYSRFADCSFMQGDYFGAIQAYKGVLTSFPTSKLAPRANFYLGRCFQELQVYNAAINVFLEGPKKYPASPYKKAMEFALGQCYFEKGNFRHAYKIFNQYLVDGIDTRRRVEANFYAAECLFNEKEYIEALSAYNAILTLAPVVSKTPLKSVYKRIGDCYKELGQLDKSILAYQGKAIETHPFPSQ